MSYNLIIFINNSYLKVELFTKDYYHYYYY